MAAINLTDIVKTYDDGFTAVKGVSLDIADACSSPAPPIVSYCVSTHGT